MVAYLQEEVEVSVFGYLQILWKEEAQWKRQ